MIEAVPDFPAALPDPGSYYRGADTAFRIRSRNAVVFMRNSKANLQQSSLSNLAHHRYVWIFVIETPGVVSLEGSRMPLKVGESLLVLPYQFHHYVDLGDVSLRWLFLTFDVEFGEDLLEMLNHRVLQPDEQSLTLVRRIVELWRRKEDRGRAGELLASLDHLLLRLTVEVERQQPNARVRKSLPENACWIVRAESLVMRSLREGWTIANIAEKLNVSERHFRTRFKTETGVSVRRYKANIQLHRALGGMKDSHLSMGQISELSGFQSQAVFTRFMQRETGRSPTECRRLLGSGSFDEIFPR